MISPQYVDGLELRIKELEAVVEGTQSANAMLKAESKAAWDHTNCIAKKLTELESKLNETALSLEASENLRRGLTDQLAKGSAQLTETLSRLDTADQTISKQADEISAQDGKLDRLEELLATAYQLAGLVGAPVRFLDAYSRHEGNIDSLLPVDLKEIEEVENVRLANVEAKLWVDSTRAENIELQRRLDAAVGEAGQLRHKLGEARNDLKFCTEQGASHISKLSAIRQAIEDDAKRPAVETVIEIRDILVERGSSIDDVTPKEPPPRQPLPENCSVLLTDRTLGLDQLDAPGGPKRDPICPKCGSAQSVHPLPDCV